MRPKHPPREIPDSRLRSFAGGGHFSVEPEYWVVTIAGAFLGPCLAHVLIFKSYRHWELTKSALVSATQPLFVIPLALIFLSKAPQPSELAGGAILMLGALWFSWLEMRSKSRISPKIPLLRSALNFQL